MLKMQKTISQTLNEKFIELHSEMKSMLAKQKELRLAYEPAKR